MQASILFFVSAVLFFVSLEASDERKGRSEYYNGSRRYGFDYLNNSQYDCGVFHSSPSGNQNRNAKVIGGHEVQIEEFPWQVSLQKFRMFPLPVPDWSHTCGAAILNEVWLLTAAHCVDGLVNTVFPGQLRAVIGTDRWRYTLLQRNIQLLSIDKIERHPQWNHRKAQNDIALIRVSKPIAFNNRASPICLPSTEADMRAGSEANEMGTIAGFGYTTDNVIFNILPNHLQAARLPFVPMERCKKSYNRTRVPLTDSMLCAGSAIYGRCVGALRGDSGSALITYNDQGRAVHTGIVSFSLPCRLTGAPDVFTRTSKYVDWINSVINKP